MKTVTRQLVINHGNVDSLCTGSNVRLSQYSSAAVCERNKNPGYLTLNSTARASLFPSAQARPYKLDSMMAGRVSAGKVHIDFMNGNSVLHSDSFWTLIVEDKAQNNITSSAVTSLTPNSNIRYKLQQDSRVDVGRLHNSSIVLYFYQYNCTAVSTDGVNASVSNSQPYQGESVTFTASVAAGFMWQGWFSDPACTQLVTKNLSYTTAPNSDLTLYAKAERPVPQTAVYIKINGQQKLVKEIFQKASGAWTPLPFEDFKLICENNRIEVN